MSRLPGIDDETLARAGLTAKQTLALSLYVPGERGYRSVALGLDISRDAARDRIREGLRKLEVAMRPPTEKTPAHRVADTRGPAQPSQPGRRAPVASPGIQVFAD